MGCPKPVCAIDATDEMWSSIPEHLQEGLARFLDKGIVPGSFLTACLKNDLLQAATRAHPALSLDDLRTIMRFLFTGAPAGSWGNSAAVHDWVNNPLRKRLMKER